MNPTRRSDDVQIQEVGCELVVYDQRSHQAHRLNQSAALVYRHADGKTSIDELAGILHAELGLPADAGLVSLALSQLSDATLLEERMAIPRLGTTVALAGALALLVPVVETLLTPMPAAADISF